MKAPYAVWLAFVLTALFAVAGFAWLGDADQAGPDESAAKPLVEQLRQGDVAEREQAIAALGKMASGAREVVPSLIEALRDRDAGVRVVAARLLGQFGPEAKTAIPALTQAMADGNERVLQEAILALRRIEGANPGQAPAVID